MPRCAAARKLEKQRGKKKKVCELKFWYSQRWDGHERESRSWSSCVAFPRRKKEGWSRCCIVQYPPQLDLPCVGLPKLQRPLQRGSSASVLGAYVRVCVSCDWCEVSMDSWFTQCAHFLFSWTRFSAYVWINFLRWGNRKLTFFLQHSADLWYWARTCFHFLTLCIDQDYSQND
jgi:hypothetical protein